MIRHARRGGRAAGPPGLSVQAMSAVPTMTSCPLLASEAPSELHGLSFVVCPTVRPPPRDWIPTSFHASAAGGYGTGKGVGLGAGNVVEAIGLARSGTRGGGDRRLYSINHPPAARP